MLGAFKAWSGLNVALARSNQRPSNDSDLDKIHKLYRLVAYDVRVGYSKFWGGRREGLLLRVFTRKFENSLPHALENVFIYM